MPVIWICIAFAAGILSADQLGWGVGAWVEILAAACLGAAGYLYLYRKGGPDPRSWLRWLIPVLLISFPLGAFRYQLSLPDFEDPQFITQFIGESYSAELTGVVVGFPDERDQYQNLRVRVSSLDPRGEGVDQPARGLILARVPAEESVSYGDEILLTGYLGLPPEEEDFNYREYLARQGIYAYMSKAEMELLGEHQGNAFLQVIYNLRAEALIRIYTLWPDPEASLLAGILLGVESGISDQVQSAFRETGTTHIIAISGFNITIVAGLFARFFSRLLNRRQGALAAVLGIGLYTLLVGGDPAVVRAAVMGGLSIFAHQIGRRQHGLNAAALASLIMILCKPPLLWDISFQLSLAATLGLILYADPLAGWFLGFSSRFLPLAVAERITRPVSEYLLFTLAAQLTTLPVMVYHFKSFSLSALLANPAILPVQPPIMILGGLALMLGVIWLPLGRAAAPLVYPCVLYTIRAVEWISRFPLRMARVGEIGLVWIAGFYLLLALLTFGKALLIPLAGYLKPASAAAGLALAGLLVWRGFFSAPDGRLHLILLDVGTGSAVYLESPSGQKLLINGGPSTRLLSDQLGRRLPPFQRELDLVLVASPRPEDLDALAGVLPRFQPESVIWLGDPSLCWEAENLRSTLQDLEIPLRYGEKGETLVFSDGLQVKILSVNQRGGILLVQYGSFRALFPFGLSEEDRQETRQGRDLGEISVYYLADNGSQSSNPSEWVDNLHPELLLLSVGVSDSRGLPDRGLIASLGGYSLLRTDQHGTIHLITDGERLWIRVDSLDGL